MKRRKKRLKIAEVEEEGDDDEGIWMVVRTSKELHGKERKNETQVDNQDKLT